MKFYDRYIGSQHHDLRPEGCRPTCIVVHHTGGRYGVDLAEATIAWFRNPMSQVSTHAVIGKDGVCTGMVPPLEGRAWGAGYSSYKGAPDVNDYAVQVELANVGDGKDLYTEPQLRRLIQLCADVCIEYGIDPQDVVGHKDVNTSKRDPVGLDLELLREFTRASVRERRTERWGDQQSPVDVMRLTGIRAQGLEV